MVKQLERIISKNMDINWGAGTRGCGRHCSEGSRDSDAQQHTGMQRRFSTFSLRIRIVLSRNHSSELVLKWTGTKLEGGKSEIGIGRRGSLKHKAIARDRPRLRASRRQLRHAHQIRSSERPAEHTTFVQFLTVDTLHSRLCPEM